MLKNLTTEEWEYILDGNCFKAVFDSAILVDREKQDDPFTQTQIAVKLVNPKNSNDYMFLIFDNTGLINLIKDNKILSNESNEYNIFKAIPDAIKISYMFASYMSDKYGVAYLENKIPQTNDLMSNSAYNKRIMSYKLKELEVLKNLTKLSTPGISKEELDKLSAENEERLKKAITLLKEIEFEKAYIDYLKSLNELLIDNLAVLRKDDFSPEFDRFY